MARSRNIKPGFFSNDDLAEISVLGRLLFIGLWTIADRDGRLEDRPKRIKAEIIPYDDGDVDTLLGQLQDRGFILRYAVDGRRFIQIINFAKHQNPHVKEPASSIPPPVLSGSSTRQEPDSEPIRNGGKPGASTVQEPEQEREDDDASTVQAPDKHQSSTEVATLIPDSGFLIPDSGDKRCRARPPDDVASAVLGHLNRAAGRSFRPVEAHFRLITARLREGNSPADLIAVIDAKVAAWKDDPKMSEYLRPETLFSATKFASYVGSLPKKRRSEWWLSMGYGSLADAQRDGVAEPA